jgi:hypothetical protein
LWLFHYNLEFHPILLFRGYEYEGDSSYSAQKTITRCLPLNPSIPLTFKYRYPIPRDLPLYCSAFIHPRIIKDLTQSNKTCDLPLNCEPL